MSKFIDLDNLKTFYNRLLNILGKHTNFMFNYKQSKNDCIDPNDVYLNDNGQLVFNENDNLVCQKPYQGKKGTAESGHDYTGPQGIQGERGDKGLRGDDAEGAGLQGKTGPQGLKGKQSIIQGADGDSGDIGYPADFTKSFNIINDKVSPANASVKLINNGTNGTNYEYYTSHGIPIKDGTNNNDFSKNLQKGYFYKNIAPTQSSIKKFDYLNYAKSSSKTNIYKAHGWPLNIKINIIDKNDPASITINNLPKIYNGEFNKFMSNNSFLYIPDKNLQLNQLFIRDDNQECFIYNKNFYTSKKEISIKDLIDEIETEDTNIFYDNAPLKIYSTYRINYNYPTTDEGYLVFNSELVIDSNGLFAMGYPGFLEPVYDFKLQSKYLPYIKNNYWYINTELGTQNTNLKATPGRYFFGSPNQKFVGPDNCWWVFQQFETTKPIPDHPDLFFDIWIPKSTKIKIKDLDISVQKQDNIWYWFINGQNTNIKKLDHELPSALDMPWHAKKSNEDTYEVWYDQKGICTNIIYDDSKPDNITTVQITTGYKDKMKWVFKGEDINTHNQIIYESADISGGQDSWSTIYQPNINSNGNWLINYKDTEIKANIWPEYKLEKNDQQEWIWNIYDFNSATINSSVSAKLNMGGNRPSMTVIQNKGYNLIRYYNEKIINDGGISEKRYEYNSDFNISHDEKGPYDYLTQHGDIWPDEQFKGAGKIIGVPSNFELILNIPYDSNSNINLDLNNIKIQQ